MRILKFNGLFINESKDQIKYLKEIIEDQFLEFIDFKFHFTVKFEAYQEAEHGYHSHEPKEGYYPMFYVQIQSTDDTEKFSHEILNKFDIISKRLSNDFIVKYKSKVDYSKSTGYPTSVSLSAEFTITAKSFEHFENKEIEEMKRGAEKIGFQMSPNYESKIGFLAIYDFESTLPGEFYQKNRKFKLSLLKNAHNRILSEHRDLINLITKKLSDSFKKVGLDIKPTDIIKGLNGRNHFNDMKIYSYRYEDEERFINISIDFGGRKGDTIRMVYSYRLKLDLYSDMDNSL